ncbi:MAG: carboxypeptidase-like regulatory domain-containing protein [Bacteroidales bacterium]|nr:carboxypeptidase-like regulatory domain-containing protein [Bacteroidales bacterium]
MILRETYQRIFPVLFSLFLLVGTQVRAQQKSILEREVNLSQTTGEIDVLLKEISRKANFSFTYTSQIQVHRIASVSQKRQSVGKHLGEIFRFDSIQFVEQYNKVLLIPLTRKSETVADYRLIKGLVIDARNRKPLSFANIFLLNKSIGTISNASGRFELKLKTYEDDDTIGISFIGYKMYKAPLATVDTATLIVRLSSEMVHIDEVIVKPMDPIYILTKAIEQIRVNYDHQQNVLTAFYRETTRQDGNNISSSEAVINIFKEAYTSTRLDQVRLFKGRKWINTADKAYIDLIVQGGLYNSFQLDIVKNLPTFLDADYFALYEYNVERIILHYERPTYVISFDQREDVIYPCYKGQLYIDVESLAIVGASFEMSEKNLNYNTRDYVKKSPRTIRANPTGVFYEVYYRYYGNKWNLSNARSEIQIRIRQRRDQDQDKFNSIFESVSEFVITSKDTTDVSRFRFNETSKPRDILVEQIGETDIEFWGSENIIIPEEPIERTILRLGRRNNLFTEEEIRLIKIEEEKEADRYKKDTDENNEVIDLIMKE